MRLGAESRESDLIARLSDVRPTHLVARTPMRGLLRWAADARVSTLPLLADHFRSGGPRRALGNLLLRRLLNRSEFRVVANHNIPAARSLVRIGVDPWKVVPYDYEPRWGSTPADAAPKPAPAPGGPLRLVYVGALKEAKGLGDCIEALACLRGEGSDAVLTVVGGGDPTRFVAAARRHGVEPRVTFVGQVSHGRVASIMRAHDVVVVPSRREYPEGMPGTVYDALCSRTPVVVSDHPVFMERLRTGVDVVAFRSGSPSALADAVAGLASDRDLYVRLSVNAIEAWRRIQVHVGWGEVITRFLRDGDADREWFRSRSMGSMRYDSPDEAVRAAGQVEAER
jgi:glycosyltransferase involved in cell wall biosynthesis